MTMKYKIAICDDEQNQIEYITSIVASWSTHKGYSCEIRTFASAEAFLFEYEENKVYDILLLDVEMKNMNGIELAKRIRKDNNRAEIIFITSHFEFVGEGYEVDALHYLIKPISEEKLTQVLTKAAEKLSVEPLISATSNFRFQGESMTISTELLFNITEVAYEKENIFEAG